MRKGVLCGAQWQWLAQLEEQSAGVTHYDIKGRKFAVDARYEVKKQKAQVHNTPLLLSSSPLRLLILSLTAHRASFPGRIRRELPRARHA